MATRSKKQKAQARAQRRKRKSDKRRNQKVKAAKAKASRKSVGLRHREQLKQLVPRAWKDEIQQDVAVFDEAVFASLPTEQQESVAAVKAAMELIGGCKYAQANDAVKAIPRKDDMSNWRLLVRGVTAWLTEDFDAAEKSFRRLDSRRRPWRIARVLQLAQQGNLAEMANNVQAEDGAKTDLPEGPKEAGAIQESESSKTSSDPHLSDDLELIKAARIVRRTRIDRAAIKIAEAGTSSIEPYERELTDSTISPEKIKWIKEFAADFRDLEPNLVRALELAALDRAAAQPYEDVFEEAIGSFSGPSHDPNNLLRAYLYRMSFDVPDEQSRPFLERYVNRDLPSNKLLSDSLRQALLSSIWLREGLLALTKLTAVRSPFGFMFGDPGTVRETPKTISDNFQESIKAWPANEKAHEAWVMFLEADVEDSNLSKKQREKAAKRLADAMQQWAQSIPNAAKPRKYLADFFLEQEQFEEAASHIKWVIDSRPDDPRLKILLWKSRLFEAMNLCRRKSNLDQVPEVLQQVNSLWPAWLSRRWEPYFSAALSLRAGDKEAFAKQRETILASSEIKKGSLLDACMMLGAAQRMRVPAADLKLLRQPIDKAVKDIKQLKTDELLDAASFFWEMYQTNLFYPAFRMHGSKFGKELFSRFKSNSSLLREHLKDTRLQHAMYWFSELRFWANGYALSLPPNFERLCIRETFMAAAYVNACVKMRYGGEDGLLLGAATFLKESTRKVSDPFYRFWFNELVSAAEEKQRQSEELFGNGGFGAMFGMESFGEDFEDEDCDCEECRARRATESRKQNQTKKNARPKTNYDDQQASLF